MPEVRRLFLALTGSREQRRSRLQWSVWRRAHQAIAAYLDPHTYLTPNTTDAPHSPPVPDGDEAAHW